MSHPLKRLWPRLSKRVRAGFASAHEKWGRLSTSKAVAGLRGLNGPAARVLNEMADETKVPKACAVDPERTDCPAGLQTSPCVRHAAEVLLEEDPHEIDDGTFLATLAQTSVGGTATRWKRDGFTGKKVTEMIEANRRE